MSNEISTADLLKKLDAINLPDERTFAFSRFDELGIRDVTLDEHHADIARFQLSSNVPEDVIIHFETAKNIYLYAWYVFRFYPVAEHQVLASLEMGLRMKISKPMPSNSAQKNKRNSNLTLAPLLRKAIDQGLIKNEGFSMWHSIVQKRARHRMMSERIAEMKLNDSIKSIEYDEVTLTPEDLNYDYVSELEKILSGIRNSYAHGSANLHNQVLGTFKLVSEILAQIYSKESDANLISA